MGKRDTVVKILDLIQNVIVPLGTQGVDSALMILEHFAGVPDPSTAPPLTVDDVLKKLADADATWADIEELAKTDPPEPA